MGPRRMDGMPRPTAAGAPQAGRVPQPAMRRPAAAGMRPQPQPMPQAQRPQPQPVPQARPAGMQQRPMPRQQPMAAYDQPAAPMGRSVARMASAQQQPVMQQPAPKRGGGWKVVLQFVVGLGVIAAVAAAIVLLYMRYYQ